MNFAWSNLRVLALITLLRVGCLVQSGSVKLIGPKCEGEFDGSKVKCGSTIKTEGENEPFKLGSLCDNNKDLKLRIVRDDTSLDGNSDIFYQIDNVLVFENSHWEDVF